MTPEVTTLPSGLRIIVSSNNFVETVNALVLTSVGSRLEEENNLGIAHFLEHMAFKGTVKRPSPIEINREIEMLGARTNAFTWQEYTGYFIMGNRAHLSKYLEILSDIYLNSIFPESEIAKEQGVIAEEIKLHFDEPMYRANDLFFKATFGNGVLGRMILGSSETIKAITREDFLLFKQKYNPQNTIIAVSGNTNLEEVKKALGEFANWNKEEQEIVLAQTKDNNPSSIILEERKVEQAHIRLGFKTCDIFSSDIYNSHILSTHIGSGLGSMLFEILREEMGVAYYCSSADIGYKDAGVLKISAGVSTKRLEESLERVLREIRGIKENGIQEKQLERAKEYIKGGIFMGLESTEGLNEYYAFDLLLKGKIEDPLGYAKKIDAVKNEDVIEFARKYLLGSNISLAVVGGNLPNKNNISNIIFNI